MENIHLQVISFKFPFLNFIIQGSIWQVKFWQPFIYPLDFKAMTMLYAHYKGNNYLNKTGLFL